MPKTNKFLLVLLASTLITSCDSTDKSNDNPTLSKAQVIKSKISKKLISLNNQGVGEMGSFDYDKASKTFEQVLSNNKDWKLAQQNYAISLLNRQKPGDEEKAIAIANTLIGKDANNLVAHYILGILNFNQGLCDQASPHFEQIIQQDKSDAYALYFSGQCQLQNGQIENALKLYQKAITANNYLRSAYYGAFMAAQRLEKTDIAKEMLNAYQKLASNPKAQLAEIKYTRMGPKVNAKAYNLTPTDLTPKVNKGPYFDAPLAVALPTKNIDNFGVVDFHQKGMPFLYLINNNQLSIVDKSNNFQLIDKFSTQLPKGDNKLAWGDINNDNLIDFYATGDSDQLYLQTENGFNTVDMEHKYKSKAVRFADTDHDGDLDILLLSNPGEFKLINNNLDGSYTDITTEIKITNNHEYSAIYIQDIDKDRDADIILLKDNSITTLLNNRMWDYQVITQEFENPIQDLSIADNNINGIPEISLLFTDSIQSFEFEGLKYIKVNEFKNQVSKSMMQLDVNGSGVSEFLTVNNQSIKIINQEGEIIEKIPTSDSTKIKAINSTKGAELIVLKDEELYFIPANNRNAYLYFSLSGKEDDANSVRSNYSGIGTSFTLHNQGFYATGDSFNNQSGTDQDYQAQVIAAGSKVNIDYLAMEWSDGVYQTELNLDSNNYHYITETQRQLSSCPVIFVWNNGKYEFISDVLGVGGIGFAIGKNQYGVPRPWENYLLTQEQISSQDGLFKLQFTEPMEESAYLDQLQIEVMDVPKPWSVILDERMVINQPIATGDALFYQSEITPIQAITKSGKDVTERILSNDKLAIDLENNDHRFLGIVDEQIVTLEFDETLIGDYTLIMNGWVEYGYSQTMFAAWQAGISAQAPTLEALIDGKWQIILTEFGYPAGMPRNASVPIKLPAKTQFLRIRTNMEIYFDKLALIQPNKLENVNRYTLKLNSARLHQLGYPLRSDNKQRVPEYNFEHIQPYWDTRYMKGAYSQIGEISPLVEKNDNALAIIGAGEAIEMEFIDDLPELAINHNRYYILKFKGWAKDMDILTKDGESLAPIPAIGTPNEKAKQLNNKYNTRFKAGK